MVMSNSHLVLSCAFSLSACRSALCLASRRWISGSMPCKPHTHSQTALIGVKKQLALHTVSESISAERGRKDNSCMGEWGRWARPRGTRGGNRGYGQVKGPSGQAVVSNCCCHVHGSVSLSLRTSFSTCTLIQSLHELQTAARCQ